MYTKNVRMEMKWCVSLFLEETLVHTEVYDETPSKPQLEALSKMLPRQSSEKMQAAIAKAPVVVATQNNKLLISFNCGIEASHKMNHLLIEYVTVRVEYTPLHSPRLQDATVSNEAK